MTPQEQVEAIIVMLNPEAAGTQDAVFLVQKYITDTNAKISGLQKNLALKEAELEAKAQEVHDERNSKLAEVQQQKEEKDAIVRDGLKASQTQPRPGPGKGKTL